MNLFEKLRIERYNNQPDCTISRFFSCTHLTDTFPDGQIKGLGCEDGKRDVKVWGKTRIWDGTYDLTLTFSPKFSNEYFRDDHGNLILAIDRKTPELELMYHVAHEMITIGPVPQFDRTLMHWGNDELDTEGCYLMGSVEGKSKHNLPGVLNSRKKYTEAYPIIWRNIKALEIQGKKLKGEFIQVAA